MEESHESSVKIPELRHISQDVSRSVNEISNARQGKRIVFKTGWKKINNQLMGGLIPGKMYVIGGRPGVGKSAFSNQLIFDLVDENPDAKIIVLYWTFEMPGEEQILRSISKDINKTTYDLLSVKTPLSDTDYQNYVTAARNYMKYPIYFCSVPQSAKKIKEINEKVQADNPYHTIINLVDHSRLVQGEKDSELKDLNILSKTCMFMQAKMKSISIILSQLNRNIEQEFRAKSQYQPMLSDLYGSDSIGQDAQVVMLLQRPYDLYQIEDKYCDEEPRGLLACHIEKNRQGYLGMIPFETDLSKFSIKER